MPSALRFTLASIIGLLITYLLTVTMQALINQRNAERPLVQITSAFEFVQFKPEKQQEKPKQKKPDKPIAPKMAELAVRFPTPTLGPTTKYDYEIPDHAFEQSFATDLSRFGEYRDATPRVRTPPIYPYSAKRKGIEGDVPIRFSVNKEGKVENLRVTSPGLPKELEEAALAAMKKWLYHPRMIGGTPVRADNMEIVIEFKLEN